jgi:solute:Na+ symporter, SSS family
MMSLSPLDVLACVLFLGFVVAFSMWASRKEKTAQGYFLAGRGLGWPLIGLSLIATNISTEQFVGMVGQAYGPVGLAVASWEWTAVIAMVLVAWFLLPKFLRSGIYTMPEFLEHRYDANTRATMAGFMVVLYVVTALASVLYSGALFFSETLGLPALVAHARGLPLADAERLAFGLSVWLIGLVTAVYTVYGGLKAVVYSDLIQGLALLAGGAFVMGMCLSKLGGGSVVAGWSSLMAVNAGKMHMFRPATDADLPWPTLLMGIWVPVIFYWGLNQFITQRTLAARSLAMGQLGIFFAAALKLFLPLIIVLPGIAAAQLFGREIGPSGDKAYPYLLNHLLPVGVRGLILAAIGGAVMSALSGGLNSASTVFTLDLYKRWRPQTTDRQLVLVGRVATAAIVILACAWTPVIRSFRGVFNYIQEIWGFVSVPTFTVFLIGLRFPRVPPLGAKVAFALGPTLYAALRLPTWFQLTAGDAHGALFNGYLRFAHLHFLYHMAFTFLVVASVMLTIGKLRPLPFARVLPDRGEVDTTPHPRRYELGALLIAATVALYVVFR